MIHQAELLPSTSPHQAYRLSLLDEQNQPLGYVLGEIRQYAVWYDGLPYFFILELVITDPTHREQGLGNQLLKLVETFAHEQGVSWIRGQLGPETSAYTTVPADERVLRRFWGTNGYGLKREIYDDSIRFWKCLPGGTTRPLPMAA